MDSRSQTPSNESRDPQEGQSKPAPIPPSFYSVHPSPSASPSGPQPFAQWLRKVPGFRSGTRWKQIVAFLAYVLIATWLVQTPRNNALGVLGLLSLGAILLATNGFGLRTHMPLFRSANRFAVGGAWTALVLAMFVTTALAFPAPSTKSSGQGTGPSPTDVAQAPSPSPVVAAAVTPSPSPSPKPSPTPSPSPSPSPKPTPTPPPPPPPSQAPPPPPVAFNSCGAPSNPWHYNFCPSNAGKYIYNPDPDICSYFSCIPSFWKSTLGYVDECNDGTYSHSGGRQGACSYHGGEMRPLWD